MAIDEPQSAERKSISAAFGAKNRSRLIDKYFLEYDPSDVTAQNAWAHVYRLLLWVDQTTGLGHCYESDKCQPGKRWYSRSLAFHDWIAKSLNTKPAELAQSIDWLFLRAAEDLAAEVLRTASKIFARAEIQRRPYEGRGFPKPGEDPELVSIVKDVLGSHLNSEPTSETWNLLVHRIRQYLSLDNKRKNLVGEGFEDVISHVVARTCHSTSPTVHARRILHDIPGFNRAKSGDKPNKVDVVILRPEMRTLVTAKWSVRADREKQFTSEFTEYINAESDRKPFEYVFVTNEFDPARLMRACEQLVGNGYMFTHVVHISTDAIRATYGNADGERDEAASIKRVLDYIENGRLVSLERWLTKLDL